MKPAFFPNVRSFHPGMGQAVAERTILRKKPNGEWENWHDVANRVAMGNSLLCPKENDKDREFRLLKKHIAKASLLMSGRHLQHGDEKQPERNMEVFTNCATSSTSFLLFYLLLNGSGVGRCYDDDMILVDWNNAPQLRCVLAESHPDFDYSAHTSLRDGKHKYGQGTNTLWYEIPDSREGWAQALELWENATFEKIHKDKMLVLDFSKIRGKGSPIGGMQNRPASGPISLLNAFEKCATIKDAGMEPWRQAMYVDHYMAECVLVGGARRAARMSTKTWKDKTILDFITVKRPIEYIGLNMEDIVQYNKESAYPPMGFLWSSNNSVTTDKEFWDKLDIKRRDTKYNDDITKHARGVFKLLTEAAYADGTGEPGILNSDMLVQNDEGWDDLNRGDYAGSKKYQLREDTQILMSRLAKRAKKKKYHTITNPCGEIALNVLGGFCVIADVVPFHADTLDEAEEAFRVATRALLRVNLMNSIYNKEVTRTNRIGVGMTGVHEFAWKFFKFGFRDLIDEEKSKDFWLTMARFNRAVKEEAIKYSAYLGQSVPHTMTTIKPAGTTSKLFGLTEGWHLPALAWYMRWVQFRHDDPLVEAYKANGYPYKELVQYSGTTVIGFPTEPVIAGMNLGDAFVTAGEATPEEQYQWLKLGEKYWIQGVNEDGTLAKNVGNQISYTLKYVPEVVDYKHFRDMMRKHQSKVRACSVMPQTNISAYEYQPEEAITKVKFEDISRSIAKAMAEDIGREHVDCGTPGGCPIDFDEEQKQWELEEEAEIKLKVV
jgi:adenosylcobalamin-dependent ribonucleoside-triphosphate reductase